MYPEKAKRDQEKPKRNAQASKQAFSHIILACLFLVPSLLFILPRFNPKQFVDMALLTMMICLTIYLVYQTAISLIATAFDIGYKQEENTDFPQESGNH